jgi:predicted permease
MSLYRKAISSGITRIFALPRLSIPLIVTLGLTLGAVLSVIAISSALLLKPLQGVKNEQTIQTFQYRLKVSDALSVSYWNMNRLAKFNDSFSDKGTWAGIATSEQDVIINDVTYPTTRHDASNTILDVLGTRLIKGQNVDIEKPDDYVWISHTLWQQGFSGLDSAIGKQIIINTQSYVVAGVIEDLLAVESNTPVLSQQVWKITNLKSLIREPETGDISGELDSLLLKVESSGTVLPTQVEVSQWIENLIGSIEDEMVVQGFLNFVQNTPIEIISTDYRSKLLGDSKGLLLALFVAVIGLLIMATLNILNLFIAHYQGRSKEFAIQLTMGASVNRLRAMVYLENLPSFLLAAIAGLLVTGWMIKILPAIAGNSFPMIDIIAMDFMTVVASFVIILLVNIIFSALALVDINKQILAENLNSSGKGIQAQSNQWLGRSLMVVQLSIASLLLTCSVMLAIQSYHAVYRDLGYDVGNSYTVSSYISDEKWATELANNTEYQASELQQLHNSLSNIIENEVTGSEVVIHSDGPLSSTFEGTVYFPEDNPEQRVVYQRKHLSADYFATFKIAMLAGSNLTQQQISDGEHRIVIDENMAKTVFPDMDFVDIIGQTIKLRPDRSDGTVNPPSIVTGIVAITQSQAGAINSEQMPAVYTSNISIQRQITLTVMMPEAKIMTRAMIEQQVYRQYPQLTNLVVTSLNNMWQQQTTSQRLSLSVVLIMTALTLLLAAIGVAGLTQITTNHRKYELAVRMATGAKQATLVNFILRDALWMLAIGLGIGFIVSVLGYQPVQQQIELLPEFNWFAMTILDTVLVGIVLISVLIPAWRVISTDPMQALREE